mmetsp:Transcript_25435/g.72911  ORF Transcript_25435/g.72911 Transcript_25435/m.72911 type:complete len:304 (-) Transcript_25435:264-1175(-)
MRTDAKDMPEGGRTTPKRSIRAGDSTTWPNTAARAGTNRPSSFSSASFACSIVGKACSPRSPASKISQNIKSAFSGSCNAVLTVRCTSTFPTGTSSCEAMTSWATAQRASFISQACTWRTPRSRPHISAKSPVPVPMSKAIAPPAALTAGLFPTALTAAAMARSYCAPLSTSLIIWKCQRCKAAVRRPSMAAVAWSSLRTWPTRRASVCERRNARKAAMYRPSSASASPRRQSKAAAAAAAVGRLSSLWEGGSTCTTASSSSRRAAVSPASLLPYARTKSCASSSQSDGTRSSTAVRSAAASC